MRTAAVEAAINNVDVWLSRAPVLCAQSGAVAGVTHGGRAGYWYAEIAGYYLSHLANAGNAGPGRAHAATRAAQRVTGWLQGLWQAGPPATRVYPGVNEDWRNDAVFAFDLAMVLQGFTALNSCKKADWQGLPIAGFIKARLMDEQGSLRAVYSAAGSRLPSTWSTRMDGHHLKTAASLIAWGTRFKDPELTDLGLRTAQKLAETAATGWPHLPPHPRFYALEGALRCGVTTPDAVAVKLEPVLASTALETERTDVLAQLLRLALVCGIEIRHIGPLVSRLLNGVDSDGSVPMWPHQTGDERNTWCAIFTRQALFFYLQARRGEKLQAAWCI